MALYKPPSRLLLTHFPLLFHPPCPLRSEGENSETYADDTCPLNSGVFIGCVIFPWWWNVLLPLINSLSPVKEPVLSRAKVNKTKANPDASDFMCLRLFLPSVNAAREGRAYAVTCVMLLPLMWDQAKVSQGKKDWYSQITDYNLGGNSL